MKTTAATTTTTTTHDHPSPSMADPNEPHEEQHDPIHVLEESKVVMEEWITTVVPKIMPPVQTLWQHVTDLKSHELHHKDNVEHENGMKTTNAKLGNIFDQTIVLEKQIQSLFNRLLSCYEKIHDVLEGNPVRTQQPHSGTIALHIFGRVGHKTEQQVTLDHYYHHEFLPQYETATVQYQTVIDQCQHILLLVSNTRTCMKS